MAVDLSSYNTVATRIAEFRAKHPEGSLRPVNPEKPFDVIEVGGKTFITYTAAAYRTPDDPMPGIGVAWEGFPGRTPYTRDSELMNAETSAWGRAIVAVLAADTVAGIATREEIENRRAEQEADSKPVSRQAPSAHKPASPKPAESTPAASKDDLPTLVKLAKEAKTANELNDFFKRAGTIGALPAEVVDPDSGEKMTFQEYLFQRNDQLKLKKSPGGTKAASGA